MAVNNSYKEIYYRKEVENNLDSIVRKKKSIEEGNWCIGNPSNGYLQKIESRGNYEKVSLPMFKIRPFFKTAPFPYSDEVGPLREEAYSVLNEKLER